VLIPLRVAFQAFLNAGHYEQLKKSNALSDDLARRIEA
jgi:hypothetical protein